MTRRKTLESGPKFKGQTAPLGYKLSLMDTCSPCLTSCTERLASQGHIRKTARVRSCVIFSICILLVEFWGPKASLFFSHCLYHLPTMLVVSLPTLFYETLCGLLKLLLRFTPLDKHGFQAKIK